jgi:hypothetical protein
MHHHRAGRSFVCNDVIAHGLTCSAQTVQGSAFPDVYAQHRATAETVVNTLTK